MQPDDPSDPPLPPSRKGGGWSSERQRQFLDYLRQFGGVAAAARSVGISKQAAYAWRRRSPAFAAQWELAEAEGRNRAWEEAVRRGTEGYTTPVRYAGRVIGQRHRHDTRLLYAACYGRPMPPLKDEI